MDGHFENTSRRRMSLPARAFHAAESPEPHPHEERKSLPARPPQIPPHPASQPHQERTLIPIHNPQTSQPPVLRPTKVRSTSGLLSRAANAVKRVISGEFSPGKRKDSANLEELEIEHIFEALPHTYDIFCPYCSDPPTARPG
ncbi:hypothetical protein EJ03DRAFT_113300 [Teratosphaeria nubilosa]|uniref:Uncharacterized protein n=1 Tax=Teratosphaeria nubilosa TaxID=161662 RepID=A0A6G1L761_9PEZI|nr:hypothetical protein EJ03DRAFT_113300 [Teratosphaeria nubilosa]